MRMMPQPFHFPKEVEYNLQRRVVLLGHPLDDFIAQMTLFQVLYLTHQDPREPITLLVDSPGGDVPFAWTLVDQVRTSATPIHTHGIGEAVGLAALLVAAGAKGCRTAVKDAVFRFVPDRGSRSMVDPFVQLSGQGPDRIRTDLARERSFTSGEAIAYGLIDGLRQDVPEHQ